MAHGKEAARDLRYGRRGGRWANATPVDAALAAIDSARERGLADGTWPDGTPKGDRQCTVRGCGRPLEEHSPPCRFCGRAPEHHAEGDLELERAGRVRMAKARHGSDQPLDEVDLEVLAACCQAPRCTEVGTVRADIRGTGVAEAKGIDSILVCHAHAEDLAGEPLIPHDCEVA